MQRKISFSFRLTNIERQLVKQLASTLQRSQSDAVRFVIIEAAKQLSQITQPSTNALFVDGINQEKGEIYVKD